MHPQVEVKAPGRVSLHLNRLKYVPANPPLLTQANWRWPKRKLSMSLSSSPLSNSQPTEGLTHKIG